MSKVRMRVTRRFDEWVVLVELDGVFSDAQTYYSGGNTNDYRADCLASMEAMAKVYVANGCEVTMSPKSRIYSNKRG